MRERFQAFLLCTALAVGTLSCGPVAAQVTPLEPPTGEPPKPIEPPPPESLPKPPQQGDPRQNLDKLFEALKIAPTDDSAKYVENRIWSVWMSGGGDTANLLMTRVKTAMDGKDLDLAVKLLNSIIDIRPDYVEAWNRRATVFYMKKDFGNALADIREVLAREPRHFGALSGLGMILQDVGDDKDALVAYRRALAVHPHLERIPDLVKRLSQSVEGRDL